MRFQHILQKVPFTDPTTVGSVNVHHLLSNHCPHYNVVSSTIQSILRAVIVDAIANPAECFILRTLNVEQLTESCVAERHLSTGLFNYQRCTIDIVDYQLTILNDFDDVEGKFSPLTVINSYGELTLQAIRQYAVEHNIIKRNDVLTIDCGDMVCQ